MFSVLVPGDPERLSVEAVDGRGGGIIYTSNHVLTYKELADKLGVMAMRPTSLTPELLKKHTKS